MAGDKYTLGDDSINGTKIAKEIIEEQEYEYEIRHLPSFIDDLIVWISEATTSKEEMKADLKMLMQVDDEYIFSSISTNKYITSEDSEFEEVCEELLKLNTKYS